MLETKHDLVWRLKVQLGGRTKALKGTDVHLPTRTD